MAVIKNSSNKIIIPNRTLGNGLLIPSGATYSTAKFVTIPDIAAYRGQQMSVSLWFKYTGPTLLNSLGNYGGYAFIKHNSRTGSYEGYSINYGANGFVRATAASSAGVQSGVSLAGPPLGSWIHAVGIYYGSNYIQLYVNNVASSQTVISYALDFDTNPVGVGNAGKSTSSSYPVAIMVADLKIFNTILSSSDINTLYKSRSKIIPSGVAVNLVGDFRVENKNGKVFTDSSSNANHGALNSNYTNVETASSGQPQSGNTKWVDSYSLTPITV